MNKKPRRYAEGTSVEVEKTKADIERLLTAHGATGFMSAWDAEKNPPVSFIMFRLRGRMLRYEVPVPLGKDYERGERRRRTEEQIKSAVDAEHRRRWRSLFLVIRAKLELVEGNYRPDAFDREFMSDILLPDGSSVGDVMVPQIEDAYQSGKMPKLLPGKG